jgi:hypothetical protein
MFSMIRRKEMGKETSKETEMAGETPDNFIRTGRLTKSPQSAWRLPIWGGAAVVALTALTLTTMSESGAQRLQFAVQNLAGTPAPAVTAQKPAEPSPEMKLLAENLRLLTADRERLNARVASLENTIGDLTGSIKRQIEQQAEKQADKQAVERAERSAPPLTPKIAASIPPVVTPTPAVSAPATVAVEAPQSNDAISPPVPLPPERLAAIESPATSNEPPAVSTKLSIGIDLGGAASPDALRARWATLKANLGPALGPLQPMMLKREHKGFAPSYRLVLGPLPSNTAALAVCSRLAAARTYCRPASYASQNADQL